MGANQKTRVIKEDIFVAAIFQSTDDDLLLLPTSVKSLGP